MSASQYPQASHNTLFGLANYNYPSFFEFKLNTRPTAFCHRHFSLSSFLSFDGKADLFFLVSFQCIFKT